MQLIDTHAHIYLPQFQEDLSEMLQRAQTAGIYRIFLPNIDLESMPLLHQLADAYPDMCFPMMGLHPCDVKDDFREVLMTMRAQFALRKYCAVGEIGIDLYWDKTTLSNQVEAFKIQCQWAKELHLPIAIHARDAFNEIFEVLDEIHDDSLFGVFHCFTGNLEQAKKIMTYGNFMMGFGGVLTYPKASLDQVIPHIPLSHIVLETDAPFLPPNPHRGKRNEPAYVRLVAEKMSAILDLPLSTIAETTTANANRLFQL